MAKRRHVVNIPDIITKRFRENFDLAICEGSNKRGAGRKNLQIPDGFGVLRIDKMDLKCKIKKILRRVPTLFYIAYYVYRKVKNFRHRITNKWIPCEMPILIKNNRIKFKAYNEALADEEQKRHPPITRAMPTFICMNMDTQCNLQCIMCIRRKYPQEELNALRYDFEIYRQVADDTFPYARWVQLATAGEPLMADSIREQLRIIKKYSVK
ncbi:MAG: hypothetical protein OEZ31_09460, partial [Nitrospirota bacterium]|nr:hypothetical protein [Nitrospirota bacterium]